MNFRWFAAGAVLLAAGTLSALDRDFRAVGDGKDAPQELIVYRRAAGYTFVVRTDGRDAAVQAMRNGKNLFTLKADGSVTTADGKKSAATPVVKGKNEWGYFVADSVSGAKVNDFVDVTASYAGCKAVLPDAVGTPLRISGRKGREYNWNFEDTTILEQVSNTEIAFKDFAYDIPAAGCADLVSGTAAIREGNLVLTATLRENLPCTMRVLLDTVPDTGYSGIGADYMLENAGLSKFTGSNPREWKWQSLGRVDFRREGNTCIWTFPLKSVRPAEIGRVRIRFAARTGAGMDEMPSQGKVMPILRPGNLASAEGTEMTVSGCHPMYKAYPLTDGQTSRRIHWCFSAWASNSADKVRFAQFMFPAAVPVRQMVIWWEDLPKNAEVQVLDKDGKWVTVLSRKNDGKSAGQDWVAAETGAAVVDQAAEAKKKAEKSVLPLPAGTVTKGVRLQAANELWIREIEIY